MQKVMLFILIIPILILWHELQSRGYFLHTHRYFELTLALGPLTGLLYMAFLLISNHTALCVLSELY